MSRVKVRVEKKGVVWLDAELEAVEGDETPTILDLVEAAVKAAGHKMPFGCRGGSCGTCHLHVREGAELVEAPAPMEENTLRNFQMAPDVRLSCRAKLKLGATGTLKLELPDF